ncbi:IclR family transcriptional regulator [Nitratireductor sp. GISD-1A_MAKvit]|uniref:IclR family transcriptional regulator n=1 Tax=Nitratireductor sp. GISD-1A_MAKvit TaxID=3234198 RepID=UPI003466C3CF
MTIASERQNPGSKTPSVSSALARGLRLLAVFAEAPVWMSNSEISRRTDLPAATVARLTKSLTGMGFLHYSSSRRRFRLAPGVVRLGYGSRSETRILDSIRPHLQHLADHFRVHAGLAVLDETEALYLEVCHSKATMVTLRLEAGSKLPLAGTPVGHALLWCLDRERRAELTRELARSHGPDWETLAPVLEAGLSKLDTHGYTTSSAGWHPDVLGVAVPLQPTEQAGAMALSCGVARGHMQASELETLGAELLRFAQMVSLRHQGEETAP